MNVSFTVLVSNSYTSRIMASVYIELVASSLSRTKLFKNFKKFKGDVTENIICRLNPEIKRKKRRKSSYL